MNLIVLLASIIVTVILAYLTFVQGHHSPWYVVALVLTALVSIGLLAGGYWRP